MSCMCLKLKMDEEWRLRMLLIVRITDVILMADCLVLVISGQILSTTYYSSLLLFPDLNPSFLCSLMFWGDFWISWMNTQLGNRNVGQHLLNLFLLIKLFMCAVVVWSLMLAVEQTKAIDGGLQIGFIKSMKNYPTKPEAKENMDTLQLYFGCCGNTGYQDWFGIDWISPAYKPTGGKPTKILLKNDIKIIRMRKDSNKNSVISVNIEVVVMGYLLKIMLGESERQIMLTIAVATNITIIVCLFRIGLGATYARVSYLPTLRLVDGSNADAITRFVIAMCFVAAVVHIFELGVIRLHLDVPCRKTGDVIKAFMLCDLVICVIVGIVLVTVLFVKRQLKVIKSDGYDDDVKKLKSASKPDDKKSENAAADVRELSKNPSKVSQNRRTLTEKKQKPNPEAKSENADLKALSSPKMKPPLKAPPPSKASSLTTSPSTTEHTPPVPYYPYPYPSYYPVYMVPVPYHSYPPQSHLSQPSQPQFSPASSTSATEATTTF
ncbi:hypothetical protein HELRODRAFT_177263 [Helobdella robusta]|uniref:Uncharacterized protein n=1 Tax=Helobdella robusta TaxID=6412 RepID=T1FBF3_HELRO|nr:hypothetical protein HELRODRAFT_177263 [Helobdella robusta]ESN98035.1 hypothetical protein HELRODRAFT_177263 [Helobdella robusta]